MCAHGVCDLWLWDGCVLWVVWFAVAVALVPPETFQSAPGSGAIDVDKFRHAMTSLGDVMTPAEVRV